MAIPIYIALDSGSAEQDGETYTFLRGITTVRQGHPLLIGRGNLFQLVGDSADYDV